MTDNPENNVQFLSFQFYHDKFYIFHELGTCLCACNFFFNKKFLNGHFSWVFLIKYTHLIINMTFFLRMPVLKTYMYI